MKLNIILLAILIAIVCSTANAEDNFLVLTGESQAEIVIDENPPRMVVIAALELQYYLEKISGARLPLVKGTSGSSPVKIFIGKSRFTDSLGIVGGGLSHGAFRMVSGEDWMVMLGNDYDYAPEEPWARKHSDRPRALSEWDKMTVELEDRKWGHPFHSTFKGWWNPKNYNTFMSGRYGSENGDIWNPRNLSWSLEYKGAGAGAGFWLQDEGGSLNAVYAFLRSLGARWYMPRPLGEIITEKESILLPAVDTLVIPDFATRSYTWYNYSGFSFEDVIWARRTGMNSANEVLGNMGYAHGLTLVHSRTEMKVAHPEYYALINGVRDTAHRGTGSACFTSEGLMQETAKFARFMFDHYDEPHISVWPADGYKQCQCDSCKGKSASDLVWGFVDRVATDLYQTHPDRLVSCGAYTPYIYPPKEVDKFTPNVVVFIANSGRPGLTDNGRWNSYWGNVGKWQEKVDTGRVMRVENNRFSISWGEYEDPIAFPVIHPHAMARDLKALNGISHGECCEESQAHTQWWAPGVDHLSLYVQARFLWDAGQDIDTLLEEYYTRFYGPAREEMKSALEYAESNYQCYIDDPVRNRCKIADPREMDLEVRIHFLELLHAARDTAGETVYGQRIQTLLDEMTPLESIRPVIKETASIMVIDRSSGEPVYRAELKYGENVQATDYLGRVIIDDLDTGKYVYTIDHNAYFPLTDSLVISGDTSISVSLTKRLANIRFEVSDSSGLMEGATVSLSGWKIITDNEGMARYNNQPARRKYLYMVTLDGYRTVSDSFFLEIDTTLAVTLTPATGRNVYATPATRLFPNPAAEWINIRVASDGTGMLFNPEGKIIMERHLKVGLNTFSVAHLAPGIYFLRINTDYRNDYRKVIKQ